MSKLASVPPFYSEQTFVIVIYKKVRGEAPGGAFLFFFKKWTFS